MGYTNKEKILILLIQDYYHLNDAIWTIPKDWISFQSKNKTAAIIATRRDIEIIETYKDGNFVFANLTTSTGKVTIRSVYSPPWSDFREDMKWLDHFVPLHGLIL